MPFLLFCLVANKPIQGEIRKSSVGRNGLQLTAPDTHKLSKTTLVQQRQDHQPKSTAKAVRQPKRLVPVPSKISKTSKPDAIVEETPVRDALMNRLRELASNGQNKTTGVDRQIRHIGHYVIKGSNVRAAQKATLQDVAASVRISLCSTSFSLLINPYLSEIYGATRSCVPAAPGDAR